MALHFSDKLKEIQNGEGLLSGSSAATAAADDDVEFVLHAKVTFSSWSFDHGYLYSDIPMPGLMGSPSITKPPKKKKKKKREK